jgi:hypothetical protein
MLTGIRKLLYPIEYLLGFTKNSGEPKAFTTFADGLP